MQLEQNDTPQYSFALLFDPAAVVAAAQRAAKLNLPRRVCRPLEQRKKKPVSAALAAFDRFVEQLPSDDDYQPLDEA